MTGQPDQCRTCGLTFRPYGTNVADYPGTARKGGKGQCTMCRGRALQVERMKTCVLCDKQMRPKWMPEEDWPDTNAHASRGVCLLCYHRERRAEARLKAGTVAPVSKALLELGEEIEFLLSTGDDRDTLYRNTGIAKMAVEYAMNALKI